MSINNNKNETKQNKKIYVGKIFYASTLKDQRTYVPRKSEQMVPISKGHVCAKYGRKITAVQATTVTITESLVPIAKERQKQ